MIPVYDRAASRAADRAVIEGLGVPGAALMEVASRGVARAILRHLPEPARRGVVVVCGPGNNGGDGYGAARWLRAWGVPVAVLPISTASAGDAGIQREACRRLGIPEVEHLGDAGVLVDALFGTGLTRALAGRAADLVAAMDAHPAPVVAVDLPSGLDADTGRVLGVAPHAAVTAVLGGYKPAVFTGEGPGRCGVVEVVDLGLDRAGRTAEVPEPADLAPRWPRRAPDAHKTRSGHLLVVAGSTPMAGAAVLCCRGALAAGAGLVTLVAPRGALSRLGGLPPEVMVALGGEGDRFDGALPDLDRFDAVAAGPGLGGGEPLTGAARDALLRLWRAWPRPVVADADALLPEAGAPGGPRLITPHPGEAARLLGCGVGEVQADRFGAARRLAGAGVVALLKGRSTLIAAEGRPTSVNPTGAATLATGGSGDVLTGALGALLARGCSPWDGARVGAWVHGREGERLAPLGPEGWTAGHVAAELPSAVADLLATRASVLP